MKSTIPLVLAVMFLAISSAFPRHQPPATRHHLVTVRMPLRAAEGLRRSLRSGLPMTGPDVAPLIETLDRVLPKVEQNNDPPDPDPNQ